MQSSSNNAYPNSGQVIAVDNILLQQQQSRGNYNGGGTYNETTATQLREQLIVVQSAPVQSNQADHVIYVNNDANKMTGIAAGGGCACCLILFLLLFFLIPRFPQTEFYSVTFYPLGVNPNVPVVVNASEGSLTNYTIIHTYKIYNYNMYSLDVSDFDFTVKNSLYSSPGTVYVDGAPIAEGDSIVVKRNDDVYMYVRYDQFNATVKEMNEVNSQCSTTGVVYKTSGSAKMKTPSHDFGSVDFGPWEINWICRNT